MDRPEFNIESVLNANEKLTSGMPCYDLFLAFAEYLKPMATCSLLWLPVVYYGYLWSTVATCSLLWLPAVYYGYLQSTVATCSLLWLLVVYNGYLQSTMTTCSLWLYLQHPFSAVQSSIHSYSTMPIPGLIITASMLLSLHILSLPMLLSALIWSIYMYHFVWADQREKQGYKSDVSLKRGIQISCTQGK